jgi:hypothetical protein
MLDIRTLLSGLAAEDFGSFSPQITTQTTALERVLDELIVGTTSLAPRSSADDHFRGSVFSGLSLFCYPTTIDEWVMSFVALPVAGFPGLYRGLTLCEQTKWDDVALASEPTLTEMTTIIRYGAAGFLRTSGTDDLETRTVFSKMGFSKMGFSKMGFSKMGFSKMGFIKRGFGPLFFR